MRNDVSLEIASRHRSLGLSDQQVLYMYRDMMLARKVDEQMWLLHRAGKIQFPVSCQGHEAAQVGAAYALDSRKDYLCPYYRDMGMAIVFGMTARELLLEAFARAGDPNSGGRQMPGSYGSRKYHKLTTSNVVAPYAARMALTGRLQGENFVALTALGEGACNQGEFHEVVNFAGMHKLPVIFFCENNKNAISHPYSKQVTSESIADRVTGYGFPVFRVNGNDPLEVYKVTKNAVDRARCGEGPTLIEAVHHRLAPHTSEDDDRTYHSCEEVEEIKKQDSLIIFKYYLKEIGLLDERTENKMLDQIVKEVDEALDYAEHAPNPIPESTLDHVYAE
ncbi:thiamine pyrophosphate-dependent dehydrogenase E1 component subunit alpha [Paenibacillus hamazuiensis]|uniref:thiamine pyrophosphate-dependent dehydrogenase E1 component subunit alpha n=1 Tax=Paenibacillus hamazuiensis TaxID=2936508 RepID=UPI00200BC50A|nr:thiamine pyrophosphate-dependent dehydrogenase E1 component subunit alpha [Paenibacillus hamazuiensis]